MNTQDSYLYAKVISLCLGLHNDLRYSRGFPPFSLGYNENSQLVMPLVGCLLQIGMLIKAPFQDHMIISQTAQTDQ